MRSILPFIAATLMLSGCATTPTAPWPNFWNGHYYMAGDANCPASRNVSPTRVACFNSAGQMTGYRDAMTAQQIQMWQFQQNQQMMAAQIQAQQMAQMNQMIAQNNAAMAANTNAMLSRASVYSPPQVTPIPTPGGNQVRCISVGIYANCRYARHVTTVVS